LKLETFKIRTNTGKYDRAAIPDMHGADYSVTRGHSLGCLNVGVNMIYVNTIFIIEW